MIMNTAKTVLVALLACLGAEGLWAQYSALEKPAANLTERWTTNSSGWTNVTGANALCGWTNGSVAIKSYGSGSGSLSDTLRLVAQTNASEGIFCGDYSKMEAVSFDVVPLNVPSNLMSRISFYFKSGVGARRKEWTVPFLNSYTNGQKLSVTIPFDYATWSSAGTEARFNSDRTNIDEIGFLLSRAVNETNTQFAVDNLKLIGPWGGPFTASSVPLAWVIENGMTNEFSVAGMNQDNDGDGFSNVAEFLAGTDPGNSNSFFKIEIGRNEVGQMVVRWPGNNVANYILLEANSLGAKSEFVTNSVVSPVVIKTQEVAVEQPEQTSKFFKVMITPKGN